MWCAFHVLVFVSASTLFTYKCTGILFWQSRLSLASANLFLFFSHARFVDVYSAENQMKLNMDLKSFSFSLLLSLAFVSPNLARSPSPFLSLAPFLPLRVTHKNNNLMILQLMNSVSRTRVDCRSPKRSSEWVRAMEIRRFRANYSHLFFYLFGNFQHSNMQINLVGAVHDMLVSHLKAIKRWIQLIASRVNILCALFMRLLFICIQSLSHSLTLVVCARVD